MQVQALNQTSTHTHVTALPNLQITIYKTSFISYCNEKSSNSSSSGNRQNMDDLEMSKAKQQKTTNDKNIVNTIKRSHKLLNSKTHSILKRPSSKPFQRKNDIYVSNKSNFKVRRKFVIRYCVVHGKIPTMFCDT